MQCQYIINLATVICKICCISSVLQQAFDASLDRNLVACVLTVLRDQGKSDHANKIEEACHKEITNHQLCPKCSKDTTAQ